jgi:hypothetical protein
MKETSDDTKGTCLGVVSVLDPLLGAALDRPTCSPASPIVSTNEHSEAVQISTSMPVLSNNNNTRALRCPSVAAVQEPSKPLWRSRHAWRHSMQGSASHMVLHVNAVLDEK